MENLLQMFHVFDLVLGGGAPVYHREWSEPSYFQEWKKFNIDDVEQPKDLVEVAKYPYRT